MKLLIISDIHGIKTNLEKIREKFNEFKCDKLVVLGDLLYIGPRNRMNDGYDIDYVKNFLNSYKDKIICIKGNCDSEVDDYVFDFPIMNGFSCINDNDTNIYLTHGHIFNEYNWKYQNTILLYGHLHIPFIKEIDTNIYINPGSISLPKEDNLPSYLYYDGSSFKIFDINDKIIAEKTIK